MNITLVDRQNSYTDVNKDIKWHCVACRYLGSGSATYRGGTESKCTRVDNAVHPKQLVTSLHNMLMEPYNNVLGYLKLYKLLWW